MARNVNLTAELEARESDVAIPDLLFPRIPPFSELKSTTKLATFPGAVILRRFRKGEVICRQGEAGWTAFYIPTSSELGAIRDAPRVQAEVARVELAKTEARAAELREQLVAAGADLKKVDSLKSRVAEAEEKVGELKAQALALVKARPSLELALGVTRLDEARGRAIAAGDAAMTALRQELAVADERGDEPAAARLRAAIAADAAGKRAQAESLASSDPALARQLSAVAQGDEARKVAHVQLSIPLPRSKKSRGILSFLGLSRADARNARPRRPPAWIPIDGPRDLDYETREGQLNEGELFGEMSCLYRSPRSATVVAARDCFMLEMLRSVLDVMNRDKGFKSKLDQVYRERILKLQLRNLPILLELDERQLERLSNQAELVDFPSGGLLYDENEPSDSMHLIRNGILRVMQNTSFLIGPDDVTDWPALVAELADGANPESGPRHRVWTRLPEPVRARLDTPPDDLAKHALLAALNEQIKDPEFEASAGLDMLAQGERVARKVWQRLAAPRHSSEAAMVRCQRLLVQMLYGSKLPEWKPTGAGAELSYEFRVDEFRDWKAAAAALWEGTSRDESKRRLWESLPEPAREALIAAKAGDAVSDDARALIVDALNGMLKSRLLLLEPALQEFVATRKPARLVMEFLPNNKGWEEHDFHRASRAYNRFVLDAVFPAGLRTSRRPEGPARTLAYRSRGEVIGEMSLVEGSPRTATCIAYGHPDDDPEREVGPIQLVRISRDVFEELKAASPGFRRHVEELVRQRRAQNRAILDRERAAPSAAIQSGRAEELGLVQGQKLMLIDLDRCTRCDECVQACVDTHDDGRSRLFLDGPRFGNYLVPTTCRSCLDPVCMIGCPVGSIHRGSNGEMIIEDWCIGCERCAKQCPYGAIQMHTEGLVPGASFGWRFASAAGLPENWVKRKYRDGRWALGRTPFVFDREFRAQLGPPQSDGHAAAAGAGPLAFRLAFDVPSDALDPQDRLILSLTTMDEGAAVWINGRPVVDRPDVPSVQGVAVSREKSRDEGWWGLEAEFPTSYVRAGWNVVAVRVTPCSGTSNRLLDLRIDRELGAAVRLVEEKAVVCDLCSAQHGQRPACVTACPHDAAIRVNALSDLPLL